MPIYVFHCEDCDEDFEVIRSVREADAPAFCEDCGEQCDRIVEKPGKFVRGKGNWSTPA